MKANQPPDMWKTALKIAHRLSVLLPVSWLAWAWWRGGGITLALHMPLAIAVFLMLQNAFVMPLSTIDSWAKSWFIFSKWRWRKRKNGSRTMIGWTCQLGSCFPWRLHLGCLRRGCGIAWRNDFSGSLKAL